MFLLETAAALLTVLAFRAVLLAAPAAAELLCEQALIVRELTFVLRLQQLVRPGINLRQKVALVDKLPLGEADLHQLTVDLCLHGDSRNRRDGAESIYDDANVALSDGCGTDRLSAGKLTARPARRLAGINPSQQAVCPRNEGDQDEETDNDANRPAAPAFNIRRGAAGSTIGVGTAGRKPGFASSSVLRVRSSIFASKRPDIRSL